MHKDHYLRAMSDLVLAAEILTHALDEALGDSGTLTLDQWNFVDKVCEAADSARLLTSL